MKAKALIILAWFGPDPSWADRFWQRAHRSGFDFLFDNNVARFADRVDETLGITCPDNLYGGTKIHDYRACFGELYRDELARYDWWGHTDYDVVFGKADGFFDEALLEDHSVQTDNSFDYLCGPWTLYRNTGEVNSLFRSVEGWQGTLTDPETSGWVEASFTEAVRNEVGFLRTNYHSYLDPDDLYGGAFGHLMQRRHEPGPVTTEIEVPFHHFRRTKEWPWQVI